MARIIVILGCLVFSGPTFAQQAAVLGVGLNDCGRFVAASREHEQALLSRHAPSGQGLVGTQSMALYVGYLDGFLTAENLNDWSGPQVGERISLEAEIQWVENYCRVHPLVPFVNATVSLRDELKKQRQ